MTAPRALRDENELGYLMRALRNTHSNRSRAAARRPATVPLQDFDPALLGDHAVAFDAREVMTANAATPEYYRQAVVAVDIEGMSYEEAAGHFRTPVARIASRVSRGRQHVAEALRGASR